MPSKNIITTATRPYTNCARSQSWPVKLIVPVCYMNHRLVPGICYETQFKHRITANTLKIQKRLKTEDPIIQTTHLQSSNGQRYELEGCFCFKKRSSSWARKKYPRNRRYLLPSEKVVLFHIVQYFLQWQKPRTGNLEKDKNLELGNGGAEERMCSIQFCLPLLKSSWAWPPQPKTIKDHNYQR